MSKNDQEVLTKASFRTLLDSCASWEYFISPSERFLYVSPGCLEITGYPPQAFYDEPNLMFRIVDVRDRERLIHHFGAIPEASRHEELEFRIIHRNGSRRWIKHHCTPVQSEDGTYLGRRGSNADITEQKRAEELLRAKQQDLELLFSHSREGFFYMMLDEPVYWNESADKERILDYVMDHQRITKVNQAMLDQYGADASSFVGQTVAQLFSHNLEHGRQVWRRFFDQGALHTRTREQRLDGTPLWIEGEYICLYDEQGRISGHFGMQRDITETKLAQQRLVELNQKLNQEIDRARSIHNRLMPQDPPWIPELAVETFYRPAQDLGADFYDIVPLKDNHVLLVLADVSGHGLDGAMIATFLKSTIFNWLALHNDKPHDLGELVTFVSRQFGRLGYPDDYFICLFAGMVDRSSGRMRYTTTGLQTELLVKREDQDLQVRPLGGLPISPSLDTDMLQRDEQVLHLQNNMLLCLTTDGLIEARSGGQFYDQRLRMVIDDSRGRSAAVLKTAVVDDLDHFLKGGAVQDDITVMVLRYHRP